MNDDHNEARMIKRLGGWTTIALLSLALAMFAWPNIAAALRSASLENAGVPISASSISAKSPQQKTVPIELLKVGDRVLAHNPEVSATERANWTEPNWQEWLQLSLTMPKADGSILSIELLRPESWLREQIGLVVQPMTMDWPSIATEPGLDPEASVIASNELNDSRLAYSPLRPIFRDLAETGVELEISGEELQAIFVEMDLPELAITGPAEIDDIQNAPSIKPGHGRVVTATFRHSSGEVIDLVVGDNVGSSQSSIGTTGNHPFWSIDREEYVQAGQLAIGERLQTQSGDTKRVISKLARPGPEPVYNLEVFAEHVYYVGKDGVLVHNAGRTYSNTYDPANSARKIDSADFNRLTDDFRQNVNSNNFTAWRKGLVQQGYRDDTIMDVVEHGTIKKGANIWGDDWGRYLEEITGTFAPQRRWHAHHQVQKGAGGISGDLNRKILGEVGINFMFSRHNLGWAPLSAPLLHGSTPQAQLLANLVKSRGNRSDIIQILNDWKAISAAR